MTNQTTNSEPQPAPRDSIEDGCRFVFRVSRLGAPGSLTLRQNSLLELLEMLHRERLDPATWIAHYAQEERGWYRRKLRRFADRLAKGTPIVEALEQTPDVLSDDQVLALRLASQSGTLGPTFASLRTAASASDRTQGSNWATTLVYWCVVGIILVGILFAFETFISPTFQQIHREMEISIPARSFMRSDQMRWVIAIGMAAVGVLVSGILMGWSVPVRRWVRQGWLGTWFKPAIATTSAPVLRMLATIAREGRPLVGALSTLAKYHADSRLQQRLLIARNEIEQGASSWESMRISGMLSSPEQNALESCPDKDSQAWILEQLASKRELDSQRRRMLVEKCVHPAIVLFFGGAVFWLASSTIVSVYRLVAALSR